MAKRHITWAVISNGAKARIMAHEDGRREWTCVRRYPPSDAVRFACDWAAMRNGEAQIGDASARRAVEVGGDMRRSGNRQFTGVVAMALNRASAERRFDDLALIAPAATLSDLRAKLSTQTRGKLMAEVAKDLTRIPVRQLERDLAHMTAAAEITPRPYPRD